MSESSIQFKPAIKGTEIAFDDNGRPVPVYSPGLPLEVQLLYALRALDLDKDGAKAIQAIARVIDDAEMRKLANGLGYIFRQLSDETDVKLFHWMLCGKLISLRELAREIGVSVMTLSRRRKKLDAKLRNILQNNVTRVAS
jgi:hypothetical protein